MPTENRSSNTDMISVPRELLQTIRSFHWTQHDSSDLARAKARAALIELLAQPAEQHQGEPVAWDVAARIADIPGVHEALKLFSEDPTGDAGTSLVREVLEARHADPGEVERLRDELPEFARTVIAKLQRFRDCAEDGQGADIGRRWFDVLVQLGLLHRVQRSPALWEITCEGDALLESRAALSYSAEPSAPVERDERASFEYHHRVCDLVRDEDCPEDYRNQSVQDSWEGWQARAALEHKPSTSDDLAAFNAAFQKAMETGWDDPIDLALQLWNARGDLERKPALDPKMIGIAHTPPAEYD